MLHFQELYTTIFATLSNVQELASGVESRILSKGGHKIKKMRHLLY